MTHASAALRRPGVAAIAAGMLLFMSVAAELAHPVQATGGRITDPPLFFAYTVAWLLGAAALVVALWDLRPAPLAGPPSRGHLVGRRISLVGAVLLVAFGIVIIVSAAVTGNPLEVSFVLFGLGLLLSAIGHIVLGLAIRRTGQLGSWWTALLVAAAGAGVAVVVFTDPWHDLGLFTFDAGWVIVGIRLLAR